MFWIFKRNIATLVSITAMTFYAVLAGGDPPVVRAVWMAGFLYLGQLIGRGSVSVWILSLTSWLMLMIDPSLIFSVSFQLSVAASYGLMVVEPWMSSKLNKLMGDGLIGLCAKTGLLTTISTMMMTMPVLWWHFGRMSLIGVLSNSLILPIVPVVMIFGAGMLVLPQVFWLPAYVFVHWIVLVIKFFGA
jgi:competence protein ComEC